MTPTFSESPDKCAWMFGFSTPPPIHVCHTYEWYQLKIQINFTCQEEALERGMSPSSHFLYQTPLKLFFSRMTIKMNYLDGCKRMMFNVISYEILEFSSFQNQSL